MSLPKFQVSLKMTLIALGILGAVLGLMGRLYRFEPELCLQIIQWSLLLGYVVAMFALVVQQRRHRTSEKAVNPWLSLSMSGLVLVWLLVSWSGLTKSDLSRLPTWYLVQRKLFTFRDDGQLVDDSNVWRELERRVMNSQLAKSDAELIFSELEESILQQADSPKWQHFSTASTLRTIADRELVSDEQLVGLAEAYYGKPPDTSLRLRTAENPLRLGIRYGHIGVDRQHPTKLIWYATKVQVDGEDVAFSNGVGSLAATINRHLELGEHEVVVELDCAFVMHDALRTFGGSCPHSEWPENLLKRWTEKVVIPVTVFTAESEIISLTTDAKRDPTSFISLGIETINMGKPQRAWLLRVDIDEDISVAMSGDLFVTIDGETFEWPMNTEEMPNRWGAITNWQLDPAKVSAKTATIEFVPNPTYLERETCVTEIWGKKIVFDNVPIDTR